VAQPEQQAREEIDRLLAAAGWRVCDLAAANIHAARGVALREFPLEAGFGFADYLLYVDGKAAGIIEAKKQGATLTGVERSSRRATRKGLPRSLPAWRRPLPFLYESTGIETHFSNGLDPEPRARPVFAFHHAGRCWASGCATSRESTAAAAIAHAISHRRPSSPASAPCPY
jgi:type I restriction enzyme R subunit